MRAVDHHILFWFQDDEEDPEAGERDADVEEAMGEQQQGSYRNGGGGIDMFTESYLFTKSRAIVA